MISEGHVQVNGRVVTRLGTKAVAGVDHVRVDGRLLKTAPSQEYYVYNKPAGCMTTMKDPQGRFCVGDVIREMGRPLKPAGRLDYQSSGLLVLTNDGELAARLTHARYGVLKTYVAKVSRRPSEAMLRTLRRGVPLSDGKAAAAKVRVIREAGSKAWVEIAISEGRNRQVRRMLEALGVRVEKLRRVAIGPVELGALPSGGARRLETSELRALSRAVGLELR